MGCDIAVGAFAGEAGVPVFARSFAEEVPGLSLSLPALARLNSVDAADFTAEKAISMEAGFRQSLGNDLSWDVALYLTRYSDVRSERTSSVECPADVVLLPSPIPIGSIGGCPAGFIPNYLLVNSYINNAGGSAHAASSFPRIGG